MTTATITPTAHPTDHEPRYVDYGICEVCGHEAPPTNDAAPEVAAAARSVAAAILAFVQATEDWEQANGRRQDSWGTRYPAQRDATEEAAEWDGYADTFDAPAECTDCGWTPQAPGGTLCVMCADPHDPSVRHDQRESCSEICLH
jgi:hypothetical protein